MATGLVHGPGRSRKPGWPYFLLHRSIKWVKIKLRNKGKWLTRVIAICGTFLPSKSTEKCKKTKNPVFRWLCADDWFAMSCCSPRPHNIIINTIFDVKHDKILNFGLGNLKCDEFWPQTRWMIKNGVFFLGPQAKSSWRSRKPGWWCFLLHLTDFQLKIMLNNKGKWLTHIGRVWTFGFSEFNLALFSWLLRTKKILYVVDNLPIICGPFGDHFHIIIGG